MRGSANGILLLQIMIPAMCKLNRLQCRPSLAKHLMDKPQQTAFKCRAKGGEGEGREGKAGKATPAKRGSVRAGHTLS